MKENESMPIERWREAVKAGSNAANYRRARGYTETKDDYFVDGVQWADEHPTKDSFKKYLAENVWNDASKKCTEDNIDIIFHSTYNNSWLIMKSNHINWNVVDKWCKLSDITM